MESYNDTKEVEIKEEGNNKVESTALNDQNTKTIVKEEAPAFKSIEELKQKFARLLIL